MAIEIVDFPIKHGDFPWQNVSSPEGNHEFVGHFRNQNYVENHIYVNVDLGVAKNESTTMIRGLIKDNG